MSRYYCKKCGHFTDRFNLHCNGTFPVFGCVCWCKQEKVSDDFDPNEPVGVTK